MAKSHAPATASVDSDGPRVAREPSPTLRPTLGFGVPATSDPHHFRVVVPRGAAAPVQVVEQLGMQALSDDYSVIDRALLERPRWNAIRAEVQRAFNVRLAAHGLAPSLWKTGDNVVDRLLGKELCVLMWAVERMDPDKIPVAVRNWLALRPEERWWLFGMTAQSTGGVGDSDRGWRLALRHALGDVAQHDAFAPPLRTRRRERGDAMPTLDMFSDGSG